MWLWSLPRQSNVFDIHTADHLQQRGFGRVLWLRTPSQHEIADLNLDPSIKPERCVMTLWKTTAFPTVWMLADRNKVDGVFLFEDTCLLAAGVTYSLVEREV